MGPYTRMGCRSFLNSHRGVDPTNKPKDDGQLGSKGRKNLSPRDTALRRRYIWDKPVILT